MAKYNIEEYERAIRDGSANAADECEKRIAAGLMDRDFYQAQQEFGEAQTQFALAVARAENADRDSMISAAGIAIGSIIAGLTSDFSPEELMHLHFWISRARGDVGKDAVEGAVVNNVAILPEGLN